MATVTERPGLFLPTKLKRELDAAGVPVLGVTCTEEGDPGVVVAVQIVCDDAGDADWGEVVDAVCAAHDPAPDPPVEQPVPDEAAVQRVASAIHDAVDKIPDDAEVHVLAGAITGALSQFLSAPEKPAKKGAKP